jgi:hypothetical protein
MRQAADPNFKGNKEDGSAKLSKSQKEKAKKKAAAAEKKGECCLIKRVSQHVVTLADC